LALYLQYIGSSYPPQRPAAIISFASLTHRVIAETNYTLVLPFTSNVQITKNSIFNFFRGIQCLLQNNPQLGDICQELGLVLDIEVLCYFFCVAAMSVALYKLMHKSATEGLAHYTFVSSTVFSALYFHIPFIHQLMPTTCTVEFCWSVHVIAGTALTLIGLVFCHLQEDEKPDEINIWDALIPPLPPNGNTNGNGLSGTGAAISTEWPQEPDGAKNPWLRDSEELEEALVGSEGDIVLQDRSSPENLGTLAHSYAQEIERHQKQLNGRYLV